MSKWEEWVKHNLQNVTGQGNIWTTIKNFISHNTLDLRSAPDIARALVGTGQPFISPPGQFIKGSMEFINYDFANTASIDNLVSSRIFLYSQNGYGDLPTLLRKFKSVEALRKLTANIEYGKIVNLTEAAEEFADGKIEIVIDVVHRSGAVIFGINLQKKFVNTTNGNNFQYADSFELQDWLISNDFKDLV
ncbi:hypothetical protein RsoM2USA_315 [Ralstonia phage RsoM2USA]|nr:hypothetical protein RsoM2USA_315 [Ralstonia phage RsoM2USA]